MLIRSNWLLKLIDVSKPYMLSTCTSRYREELAIRHMKWSLTTSAAYLEHYTRTRIWNFSSIRELGPHCLRRFAFCPVSCGQATVSNRRTTPGSTGNMRWRRLGYRWTVSLCWSGFGDGEGRRGGDNGSSCVFETNWEVMAMRRSAKVRRKYMVDEGYFWKKCLGGCPKVRTGGGRPHKKNPEKIGKKVMKKLWLEAEAVIA